MTLRAHTHARTFGNTSERLWISIHLEETTKLMRIIIANKTDYVFYSQPSIVYYFCHTVTNNEWSSLRSNQ